MRTGPTVRVVCPCGRALLDVHLGARDGRAEVVISPRPGVRLPAAGGPGTSLEVPCPACRLDHRLRRDRLEAAWQEAATRRRGGVVRYVVGAVP